MFLINYVSVIGLDRFLALTRNLVQVLDTCLAKQACSKVGSSLAQLLEYLLCDSKVRSSNLGNGQKFNSFYGIRVNGEDDCPFLDSRRQLYSIGSCTNLLQSKDLYDIEIFWHYFDVKFRHNFLQFGTLHLVLRHSENRLKHMHY